jgi:membrane fusion protein (multidrug efflux system)
MNRPTPPPPPRSAPPQGRRQSSAAAPPPPPVDEDEEDEDDVDDDEEDDDEEEDEEDEEEAQSRGKGRAIFREEALDALAQGGVRGDVMRLSPAWTQWAYWMLIAVVVATVAFAWAGTVHEYAPGVAVVRLGGRVDLTATTPGTVVSIDVRAGDQVKAGQLLVRFYGAEEIHTLERTNNEFEMQLVKTLSDPGDDVARKELARLRAEKGLAEARLEERSLRAPRAGTVSEIRIRPGQLLQAGDLALTLLDEDSPPSLVVVLPGHYRPQLKPGSSLRFEPDGFRFAYQTLTVGSVGEDVLGPAEVRRYLGELADAVTIDGPSVIVTAPLPDSRFVSEGRAFNYHHGLPGHAWARVRTRSIMAAFIPTLSDLKEPANGRH